MILTGGTESGAEEWLCPDCQRRVLLRWPPDYQRLVLEHGDPAAVHVGSKGGVQVSEISVESGLPGPDRNWLRDHGIDWGGHSA